MRQLWTEGLDIPLRIIGAETIFLRGQSSVAHCSVMFRCWSSKSVRGRIKREEELRYYYQERLARLHRRSWALQWTSRA
jgi:hypothetical protein